MKQFFKIIAGILLIYSTAGVALHALAKLESFGHHCEMLLYDLEENHLEAFTLAAGLSATLFFIGKKFKTGRVKNAA